MTTLSWIRGVNGTLGRLAPERLAAITQSAEDLGVQHRLSYRPALRGRDRQDVWSDVSRELVLSSDEPH